MILHLADSVNKDFCTIFNSSVHIRFRLRCCGLAVAAAFMCDVQELWVAFRTGKKFRYIPAHEIASYLGPDKSQALPVFHAWGGAGRVT